MGYNEAFESLTPQEFAVIYWKSQGLTHVQVGDILGWGLDNIQRINSNAHKKLGLGELLQKRREVILEGEVYPALRQWIKHHTEVLDRLRPPLDPLLNPGVVPERRRIRRIQTAQDSFNEEQQSVWGSDKGPEVVDGEEVNENDIPLNNPSQPKRPDPQPRRGRERFGILIGIAILVAVLWIANNIPTPVPTFTPEPSPSLPSTRTPRPPQTSTPEYTLTPEISPTPFPWTREDFNAPIQPYWIQSGSVVFADAETYEYDGVFTSLKGQLASLSIGNIAWTDYIISIRAERVSGAQTLDISFRVKDIDNRIVLSCEHHNCKWIIIEKGLASTVQEDQYLPSRTNLTIVVHGNTFTVNTEPISGYREATSQLILSYQYEGKFQSGGVIIEVMDMEVDHIEIQPFR